MAANNGTIKKNATASVPTGGTDVTYSQTSSGNTNVLTLQDASVSDFTARPTMEMKSRTPLLGKDGYYSKRKTEAKLVFPKKRTDGSTVFSVWRLINESAVELTDAELADQKFQASQVISDPDYAGLWKDGLFT